MKRRKRVTENNIDASDFLIPYRTKVTIFGIVIFVFGFMCSLFLIHYDPSDYSYIQHIKMKDIFLIMDSNSSISYYASKVNNSYGLLGALVANALVNNFLGYFSISICIVTMYWGIQIARRSKNYKVTLYNTLFIIIFALLFSTLFGILSTSIDYFSMHKEYYGEVGYFLGNVTIRLIGSAGGLIIIFVLIFIFLTLLLKLELDKILQTLHTKLKFLIVEILKRIENIFIKTSDIGKTRKQSMLGSNRTSTQNISTSKPLIVIDKNNVGSKDLVTELNNIEDDQPAHVKINGSKQSALVPNQTISTGTDSKKLTDNSSQRMNVLQPWDDSLKFELPNVHLLDSFSSRAKVNQGRQAELNEKAKQLIEKLSIFGVEIQQISITPGPVVTLFEVVPKPHIKVNEITRLQNDLTLALRANSIRIIAPMPGKGTVGIEIPNVSPDIVLLQDIFSSDEFINSNYALPLGIGKTITGQIFIKDLASMPHLLVAGSTGSGKSVGLNTIINSLIFKLHPAKVKFVIIDPKRIDLKHYNRLKNHYLAICPDISNEIVFSPEDAIVVLKSLELEMEKRYEWMGLLNARNIQEYNSKFKSQNEIEREGKKIHKLPYIVVIVDELADLIITASKQIEDSVMRLAQMSRAAGIHLIFATQRPSTQILSGNIKVNFPARIAYKVSSRTDSIVVLDATGAEQLIGNGDLIFTMNDEMIRVQNAFINSEEIERILNFIEKQPGYDSPYILPSVKAQKGTKGSNVDDIDEMFAEAAKIVVKNKIASVTFLQRRLKLGYARAARIMDELENIGVVGPLESGKNRLVLIETEEELEELLNTYGIK